MQAPNQKTHMTRISRYVDDQGAPRFKLHFSCNDKAFDIDVLPSHTMEQLFNIRESAIQGAQQNED